MNNEQTLEFIEDYRSYECLWNMRCSSYTNKIKRYNAYADLAKKYNLTEKAVRNKIKSLRSYFSKEHQKVTERKSGSGTDSNYEATWFAYQPLLFIADSVTTRQTKDSLNADNSGSTSLGEGNIHSTEDKNEEEDDFFMSRQPFIYPLGKHMEIKEISGTAVSEPIRTQRTILKRKRDNDDDIEAEALNFLRSAATVVAQKDDCTIFGQMVAAELRKLNSLNKAIAKNKIQNIIFDLQMEEMSSQTFVLSSKTQVDGQDASHSSLQMSPSVLGVADGKKFRS